MFRVRERLQAQVVFTDVLVNVEEIIERNLGNFRSLYCLIGQERKINGRYCESESESES